MIKTLATFYDHLESHDIDYEPAEPGCAAVRFTVKHENEIFSFLAIPDETDIRVAVFFHIKIPDGCLADIAETVCRINSKLTYGNFDFCFERMEVTFHIHSFFDSEISDETIKRLMATAQNVCVDAQPVFLSVIYGNTEPAFAVNQAFDDE